VSGLLGNVLVQAIAGFFRKFGGGP
jgi:hypothetical protein